MCIHIIFIYINCTISFNTTQLSVAQTSSFNPSHPCGSRWVVSPVSDVYALINFLITSPSPSRSRVTGSLGSRLLGLRGIVNYCSVLNLTPNPCQSQKLYSGISPCRSLFSYRRHIPGSRLGAAHSGRIGDGHALAAVKKAEV